MALLRWKNGLAAWNILQKADSPQMAILDVGCPRSVVLNSVAGPAGMRATLSFPMGDCNDDKQNVVAGSSAGQTTALLHST
jgi:hypothetical protein